jgi:hypothetical protein
MGAVSAPQRLAISPGKGAEIGGAKTDGPYDNEAESQCGGLTNRRSDVNSHICGIISCRRLTVINHRFLSGFSQYIRPQSSDKDTGSTA